MRGPGTIASAAAWRMLTRLSRVAVWGRARQRTGGGAPTAKADTLRDVGASPRMIPPFRGLRATSPRGVFGTFARIPGRQEGLSPCPAWLNHHPSADGFKLGKAGEASAEWREALPPTPRLLRRDLEGPPSGGTRSRRVWKRKP